MGIAVACIAVARSILHLFEGEFVEEDSCTFVLVHSCLNCICNQLWQMFLELNLFCECQHISHVLKHIDLKSDDVINFVIQSPHRLVGHLWCYPDQYGPMVSSFCSLGHLAKEQ